MYKLTVQDLVEMLDTCDPSAEVRFAAQPSWPLEYAVQAEVVEGDGVVYLGEASQVGYLPGSVAEQLGWR